MRKTVKQIVEEIASTYTLNTRSVKVDNGSTCMYNGDDDRYCAFAMMCINPSKLEENTSASALLSHLSDSILKEEYRGYSYEFYNACQELHDNKHNWDESGLSLVGRLGAVRIIRRFS